MSNLQKLFYSVIVVCLLVSLGAAPAAASLTSAPPQQGARAEIPDTYALVAENDVYALYANQETLAFKVLDKRNDYVWHSSLDEKIDGDRLNKTWTAFAASGISIDTIDQNVNEERASITAAEHTIDFKKTEQGFEGVLTFTQFSISITVNVSLNKDGVTVGIPFAGINEADPMYRIFMMHVYPFFGSTRTESTGYMFIPDGSGSLIRFQAETKARNAFYGRYYGDDLGMIGVLPYDWSINRAYKIAIPVIGMAHGENQNAYIAVVEKGASYGEFRAHPSGIITNFNFLYNTFIYNESYFQATNRSGSGVTVLQPKTNQFDVKIHYRFLAGEDSNYVGMARNYQQYLVEKGDLKKSTDTTADIGIRLEFLGGDFAQVLFWNRMIPMTTVAQMSDILNTLNISNPEVIYYGWQPLGASRMPPRSFKLDPKLGSLNELEELMQDIQSKGGRFFLYVDPQAAYWDVPGYSTRADLAMSITNNNIVSYNRYKVNFFRNYDSLSDYYTAISTSVNKEMDAGLALDSVGSNLYSDFKRGHFLSREDAILKYQDLIGSTDGLRGFYIPNDYVFRFMQAYYDIPVSDSGYIYTTDTIPFLQIAFAGYVPFYGSALNFSSNLQEDMLLHADFGVYPSFFLTQEVTAKILDTRSAWIYTSAVAQWSEQVETTYHWLNNLLGPVKSQEVISREELGPGVFGTTYANGKMIVVNYSNLPFSSVAVNVPARDAVLTEVNP